MTHVLGELLIDPRASVYLDDIVCEASSIEENSFLTTQILQKLNFAGMTINFKKTEINSPSITFLGRTIDGYTRTTKEDSVRKVESMKSPKDIKTLRSFLGLCSHFRAHLKDFAKI